MRFSLVTFCILVVVTKETIAEISSGVFTIHTKGCTIPGFPGISESIKSIMDAPPAIRNCSSGRQLVTTNSTHIWVLREAFYSYDVFREDTFYCCYKNFSAVGNIENIVYSDCEEFSNVIPAKHEFVHIECFHLDGVIFRDFFIFNRHETVTPNRFRSEEYNILLLGIESMSRLNFHRTMPHTSEFLKQKGVIELLGYNKVGDNSYPNLFPVLTGLSFDYVKQSCVHGSVMNNDHCKFIWDKFKDKGYNTALGSDSTAGLLGNYEYSLPSIPTDFYLQPFIFETRKLFTNQNYSYHSCKGSKYFYRLLLDYIYSLTQNLKSNKLFGMFWEESISHENVNNPRIMDESYYKLLSNLDQDGYLNKTILILLSDHGMRWGRIVLTKQGRLEERLPLLAILFPEEFKSRYKLAYKNIENNVNRLTSPYDIYESLLDLMDPDRLEDNVIGSRSKSASVSRSSLFLPIPAIRNCSSIGVAEHWCACRGGVNIKVGSKAKTFVANKLVAQINKLLIGYSQCQKLILKNIYDVHLVENNQKLRVYTARVKTKPGGGIFDGTVIQDGTHWVISGTVSRLNLYRNQSYCVNNAAIKMYCYCV
nr:uncharacterized protein LOC110373149 [Helicoverpa armigera]